MESEWAVSEIWHESSTLIIEHDITTITESKLDEFALSGSLSVSGYKCFRQDRNCNGGGVITYINNKLKPKELSDLQDKAKAEGIEATIASIHIAFKRKLAVVIGVYRPPGSRAVWFQAFNELLVDARKYGHLLILGDLNSDLLKSNQYPGTALMNSLELAGTLVASDELQPTRITSTTATCLDIIAIDKDIFCSNYKCLDMAASDHFPVSASLNFIFLIDSTNNQTFIYQN